MGGAEHWTLPRVGRRHTVDVDGERWHIRPPFGAVLRVSQAATDAKVTAGVEMTDAQLAIVKEACVREFLTDAQREAFEDADTFPTERQAMMAEKLFRIYNEIRSGEDDNSNPDDPPPPKPEAPAVDEEIAAPGPDPTPSPSE